MLSATILCVTGCGSKNESSSADTKTEKSEEVANAEEAETSEETVALLPNGEVFNYTNVRLPDFKLICPTNDEVMIYKSASDSAPCLYYETIGEYWGLVWSDALQNSDDEYETGVHNLPPTSVTCCIDDSDSKFYKVVLDDKVGYVHKAECREVSDYKLDMNDVEKTSYPVFMSITQGPLSGFVIQQEYGEGGTWYYLGRIDKGVLVFSHYRTFSSAFEYDAKITGIKFDEGTQQLFYGKDVCSASRKNDFKQPMLDLNKLSLEQQLQILHFFQPDMEPNACNVMVKFSGAYGDLSCFGISLEEIKCDVDTITVK